jgi:hypothetical protein
MQTHNLSSLECETALSDLILQAARQAVPKHVDHLIRLPDCGARNQPLMPLLVGLIDAARVTAIAVADNAWDSGQAIPADLINRLKTDVQAVLRHLQAATDVF